MNDMNVVTIRRTSFQHGLMGLAFLNNTCYVADGVVVVGFAHRTREPVFASRIYDGSPVSYMSFSFDGTWLFTISDNANVVCNNFETKACVKIQRVTSHVYKRVIAGDEGTFFVCGSSKYVQLINHETAVVLRAFDCLNQGVLDIKYNPKVRRLLACGLYSPSIFCWDVDTGNRVGMAEGVDRYEALAWISDMLFACGSLLGNIEVWSTEPFVRLRRMQMYKGRFLSMVAAPDCRHILYTTFDQTFQIWDFRDNKIAFDVRRPRAVYRSSVSPNGEYVACSTGSSPSELSVYRVFPPMAAAVKRAKLVVSLVRHIVVALYATGRLFFVNDEECTLVSLFDMTTETIVTATTPTTLALHDATHEARRLPEITLTFPDAGDARDWLDMFFAVRSFLTIDDECKTDFTHDAVLDRHKFDVFQLAMRRENRNRSVFDVYVSKDVMRLIGVYTLSPK